jgi:monoamine oxidase
LTGLRGKRDNSRSFQAAKNTWSLQREGNRTNEDKPGRKGKVNRREVLKLLGAGAAVTLSGGRTVGGEMPEQGEAGRADVVVVGAGFAGLVAARNLTRAGKKVVLLEARDRVGGRVKRGKLAGHDIDLGGMWVGPTQTRLLEFLKEYGLHTTPQFEEGTDIVELNAKRTTAKGEDWGWMKKRRRNWSVCSVS